MNSTKAVYGRLNVTLQGPIHYCAPLLDGKNSPPSYNSLYPWRMELMDTVSYPHLTNDLLDDIEIHRAPANHRGLGQSFSSSVKDSEASM